MCILTEFCDNGSLQNVLENKDFQLTHKQIINMAIDCATGLDFIHSLGIIHRDIKSLNFLVDKSFSVKLAGNCKG